MCPDFNAKLRNHPRYRPQLFSPITPELCCLQRHCFHMEISAVTYHSHPRSKLSIKDKRPCCGRFVTSVSESGAVKRKRLEYMRGFAFALLRRQVDTFQHPYTVHLCVYQFASMLVRSLFVSKVVCLYLRCICHL